MNSAVKITYPDNTSEVIETKFEDKHLLMTAACASLEDKNFVVFEDIDGELHLIKWDSFRKIHFYREVY